MNSFTNLEPIAVPFESLTFENKESTQAARKLLDCADYMPHKQPPEVIEHIIKILNLPPVNDLNFTYEQGRHAEPCKYKSPCITVNGIDHNHTPLFIPEGKDCVCISTYGYYTDANGIERFGDQTIYFTPDDAKIYIIDETTGSNTPRIIEPTRASMNRSNGGEIEYPNDFKIHSMEQFRGEPGYIFSINDYTIKVSTDETPSSTYEGRDLNKAWEENPHEIF
jgi:hypothetical protein